VTFYLNGREVTLDKPSPDLLLIDYLRSPDVGLAGPKKPCGEGGCGGCTVILSHWNAAGKRAEHRAINSCLRPVCALEGLVVTTVEGTGAARQPNPEYLKHSATYSRAGAPADGPPPPALLEAQEEIEKKRWEVQKAVQEALSDLREGKGAPAAKLVKKVSDNPSEHKNAGMNPVAYRLALNNGSQCGYCSVGFVMNMSEFITNKPKATKRQIEDIFDGNLCRCTGYRPILTGMKTFASDWSKKDEAERMKCLGDPQVLAQLPADVAIPFPPAAQAPPQPVRVIEGGRTWLTPVTLNELAAVIRKNRGRNLRLVHGNTSFGIYKQEYWDAEILVDIRLIPELAAGPDIGHKEVRVGAGISYNDLIEVLETAMTKRGEIVRIEDENHFSAMTRLGAVHFMARRTAGRIVRNAASLGGNVMLVLKHIAGTTLAPFPSDAVTALVAVEAEVEYLDVSGDRRSRLSTTTLEELVNRVAADTALADSIILIGFRIPTGRKDDVVMPQKVALREVNAHSIVNAATRFEFSGKVMVSDVALVFGGIAPFPWRASKTEAAMKGRKLSLDALAGLAAILQTEVREELVRWEERYRQVPWEGFTDEYRVELAVSLLYKSVINALGKRGVEVPEKLRSSGRITWGRWPVSDGRQYWKHQHYRAPVALPYIKIMAMYQTSGQVHYTHELQTPPLTANGALVQSRRALANYHFILPGGKGTDAAGLRAYLTKTFHSFIDLITHENVTQGGTNLQGMGADQALFAVEQVGFVGQTIALVLAQNEQDAIRIADYVTAQCVGYSATEWPAQWNKPPWNKPPWNEPIVSLEQAIRMNSVFPDSPSSAFFVSHIWKITRPASRFDWATAGKDPLDREIVSRGGSLDGVPCQIVESSQITGGQVHFYMERQACVAEPADGRRMIVHPSTQSPMEMHQTVAMALGVEYHRIDVQVPQVGGGFGGKTEQTRFVVGPTVVAAHATKRSVRVAVPREHDTALIGKRHAYYGQYQIAVDRGEVRAEDRGLIHGWQTRMWGDGGFFYDCSFIVSNCIQLRADSAYRVKNFENQIDVCRTNKAPNTAFRAFGDVQAKVILENAIDDAAFAVGMLPEDVREKNLYDRGDVTPFGQALSYCYIKKVWSFLKEKSKYAEKRGSVDDFNAKNKWRKRGLAMIPVKYGSGYNLVMLEQAAAFASIFQADGSVVINQGGVEMGQGLTTQVLQVASYILNVPMELIYVDGPRTSVTPNPTSSGASTGTTYNVEVVKQICEVLRTRLTEFGYEMLKENGDDWCKQQHIDFWNYGVKGWATEVDPTTSGGKLIWQNLVAMAYQQRVSLVAAYTSKIRGGETPVPAFTFKPADQQPDLPGVPRVPGETGGAVDSFTGFTFSAACSVVEIDVLTGETKILSSDIVYDMGWSLNPAIDIGQVEGAFIQGVGFLLSEKMVFEPEGEDKGRLNTLNTWTYKIPASVTIPLEMNVHLYPRDKADVPEESTDIMSAKEVGEPPLVLSNSVFFAVKAAVRASRLERNLSGLFRLDAPATVQEVRRACEVSLDDFDVDFDA
jgi:xanthine dehydrogenase/oxidase